MFHINNSNGFSITFENGFVLSVQWGLGTYSDNGHALDGEKSFVEQMHELGSCQSRTAEIAVIDPDGNWATQRVLGINDDVKGYATADYVAYAMNKVANFKEQANG